MMITTESKTKKGYLQQVGITESRRMKGRAMAIFLSKITE